MSSKPKSRWADSEQDVAAQAKLKKEKEEKRRLKAEKARKLEEERLAKEAADAARARQEGDNDDDDADGRPAKRRKTTPDRDASGPSTTSHHDQPAARQLLRFDGGHWGKCRSVDEFDKLNDIEEGTYGWVARAKEKASGRVVALKRLKIDANDRNGLPVTGLREIQVLRDCSHPNVVKLEEVVVGDSTKSIENIFLVLEFVEHDLRTLLQDMPQDFLPSEVKRLLIQLCAGVAYLHDHYILHRDLKTSNLLLSNRGRLKIADFGMARYVGDPAAPRGSGAKLTQLVVTLWYRAPELLLGAADYGAAVDMWSVGCIFAELLSRDPIFQGRNEVDQVSKIFELCGVPSDASWPGFRRLPNARGLKLPPAPSPATARHAIRARFPYLTAAGCALLADLLSLDPARRPPADEVLRCEYFAQEPKPKSEAMFPTFPSRAGQERRRRHEPHAPAHGGRAAELGAVDFTGLFQGREQEERGGGFTLRMV